MPTYERRSRLRQLIRQALTPKNAEVRTTPAAGTRGGGIDVETARKMLLTDFEQAFILHNDYKDAERDLYKLSLRILAFPVLVAGALVSAKLISSVGQVGTVLRLPIIYAAAVVAGVLNTIVLRAYVVTDRVQTEAKHQVNRLRSLYLHALAAEFPEGWKPVWGSTNPYLESRRKLKAAALTSVVIGSLNAAYVAVGADRLITYGTDISWTPLLSAVLALIYFLLQMEFTWEVLRRAQRKRSVGAGG
ncbi:hypothetical protein ACFFMR_05585 [Micromonospora andamanensis]|uniref:Uncharacterized protein n=1 Tax=Micromonospora andamanensis TaxID=1287068 RepID=A0ABQ4HQE8_9ACTN|nr:hypothetical protein [Micromonospora andamanensis]GIJ07860.1 hypothetical protein Van01_10740 [Micromonospora andamanensis]